MEVFLEPFVDVVWAYKGAIVIYVTLCPSSEETLGKFKQDILNCDQDICLPSMKGTLLE